MTADGGALLISMLEGQITALEARVAKQRHERNTLLRRLGQHPHPRPRREPRTRDDDEDLREQGYY